MVVGSMSGELKIYSNISTTSSADTPWKTAKMNGQISAVKIAPYSDEMLGKTMNQANIKSLNK